MITKFIPFANQASVPELFLILYLVVDLVVIWIRNKWKALPKNMPFEQPHDKNNKMTVRLAKTQINLGIRRVWWRVFAVR